MVMLGGGDCATIWRLMTMVRGKNGETRALSPELTVGGLNLNFNPNGEGSHDSTSLISLDLSDFAYLTLLDL